MKKSSSNCATSRVLGLRAIAVLLVLTVCVCAISPKLHAFPVTPPRVRFTAVLVPFEDQSRKALLDDLTIIIETERSKLLIDKMEIVGSVALNRVVLQRLFPPVVHFSGPNDLIRRLQRPEIAGKVLTIEGLLYTASRTFFLIRVDEVDECDQANDKSPCA